MIWILIILFSPVLLVLYVMYLMVKAVFIILTALLYFLFSYDEVVLGELDPVTDKVKWS